MLNMIPILLMYELVKSTNMRLKTFTVFIRGNEEFCELNFEETSSVFQILFGGITIRYTILS